MLIGMRIIKTALAVIISAYLVMWLKLDSPFYAVIAAIITMQGNLTESLQVAKLRMLGTAFGGAIGVAGAFTAPGNFLVLGLGVGLIIFAMNRLRWHKAIVIAAIVFASIILKNPGDSALVASFNRVVNTLIGIMVAVAVNYFIFRPVSANRVLKSARDLVVKFKSVLGMVVCHEEGVALSDITEKIHIIERELPGVKAELRLQIMRNNQDLDFDAIKAKIDTLYLHIAILAIMDCPGKLSVRNAEMVNKIYQAKFRPALELDDVDLVYNYHLGASLNVLGELSSIMTRSD